MNITITLTDAQYKSLQYVAFDPEEWINNAATARAQVATEEIVKIYTNRALNEGVTIPSTREEIVIDAFAREWINTVAELQETDTSELT